MMCNHESYRLHLDFLILRSTHYGYEENTLNARADSGHNTVDEASCHLSGCCLQLTFSSVPFRALRI